MNIRSEVSAAGAISILSPATVHLPGLNGLRAVAALAVVISHITLSLGEFGLDSKIFGTDQKGSASGLDLAGFGVTIFFTLSGFLITFLCLKEKEVSELNVTNFYMRRIFRIWPLYYLYFVACLIVILNFNLDFSAYSIPFYIFLAANIPFIAGQPLPLLAHFWSLGVEEQFYLFFPLLARLSNRKLFRISATLIFIFLSLKIIFWILSIKYGIDAPYRALGICRFHTMLVGVLAAVLYHNQHKAFMLISTHKVTQIASWCCIVFIALNRFHVASVIDGELVSVVTVCLIIGQISSRNNFIDLENKVCDFVGRISYGIYVIHPLVIFFIGKALGRFSTQVLANYFFLYVLILITTILAAYLSYEFYEKRFLALKEKYRQ